MKTQHARNWTQAGLSSPSRLNRHTWMALMGWLLITGVVPAADIAWTNTAGGNWSTPANWSPNQPPGPGDNAYITNAGTYTVTVSADAGVNTVTLGGPTGTQTLNLSGGTFTLNGAGSGNARAVLAVSGGTLAGSGLLALAGPLNWTQGNISGAVQCNGGSISGNGVSLFGGLLVNTGTLTDSLSPGAWLSTGWGSVISNLAGAQFIFAADSGTRWYSGARGTIYNYGWLGKSGGTGTSQVDETLNNAGTVEVDSGTLALNGGGTIGGACVVSNTAALVVTSETTTFAAGCAVTGNGTVACENGTLNFNNAGPGAASFRLDNGTANFNSATPTVVGSLAVNNGTLGGSGWVVVSNALTWTGGTIRGGVQCNGGSISGNGVSLFGGLLVNTGTLTDSLSPGAWLSTGWGSVISNLAGAQFIFAADSGTRWYSGARGTIYNYGWLGKSGGTGTSWIDDVLNSAGTLEVDSGTFLMNADAALGGACVVSNGAALFVQNGTTTLATGCSVVGKGSLVCQGGTMNYNTASPWAGNVSLNGSTVSFNSPTPTVVGSLTISGGTLGGSSCVLPTNPLSWTGGTVSGCVRCNGGNISGGSVSLFGGLLVNTGALTNSVPPGSWLNTGYGSVISNLAGGSFALVTDTGTRWYSGGRGTVYNYGWLGKSGGTGTSSIDDALATAGTLEVDSGTMAFHNYGTCVQNVGLTLLNGGNLYFDSAFQLQGGALAGAGTISGDVSSGATVSPGLAPGVLTITGNYAENTNAALQIELGGPLPGTGFSQLAVGGSATLAGSLTASLTNQFAPSVGNVFPFVTCRSLAGAFSHVYYPSNDLNAVLDYWPTSAVFQVTYLRPPPLVTNIVALPGVATCLLSWQTTAPTLGQVEYGPTTSYGSETPLTTQYSTNLSVTLSNLVPNSTVYYRIHVFDTLGKEVIAGGLSFVTLPDTTPPQTLLATVPNPVCALPLTLSWTGTDNVTPAASLVYAYRLDAQAWSAFGAGTSLVLTQQECEVGSAPG